MSILSGKSRPDSGQIIVDGFPTVFRSPKDALDAGIGMVYQHFMLIEAMTVTQNLMLGQSHGILRPAEMRKKVLELSAKYGFSIDPDAVIANLSMGERQRVEILKLLYRDCRILILDEPTAVLTQPEINQLFSALRRMAEDGKAIVFISHKMKEVLDLATEISILRRGEIVDHFSRSDIPGERALAERMIGRQMDDAIVQIPVDKGEIMLKLCHASCGMAKDISCTVHRGEILAIVGVAGNGQRELVEMITGTTEPDSGSDSVYILGKNWRTFFKSPISQRGMVYIPEDRKGVATCPGLNLLDNFLLTNRNKFQSFGFIDRQDSAKKTNDIMQEYQVVADGLHASAGSLSGGNLQKMVLGREFFRNPRLIVAENPTQGLDIGAMEEIWHRLLDARKYAAVILVTSDLHEAVTLADTFAVMYRGEFMDVFSRNEEQKLDAIGLMMAGIAASDAIVGKN
jgi:simple sugar transport system ATP-binding protein